MTTSPYGRSIFDPTHPHRETVERMLEKHVTIGVTPTTFVYRKPDSGDCLMRYTLVDPVTDGYRTLVVTGDLGAAVYEWPSKIHWRWLAGLNIDYFASKCTASEYGRGYTCWCNYKAAARFPGLWDMLDESKHEKFAALVKEYGNDPGSDHLFSESGWWNFCETELRELVDGDFEGVSDIGTTIDLRCIAHLRGIQKSFLNNPAKLD
jgi:hypothetical protein